MFCVRTHVSNEPILPRYEGDAWKQLGRLLLTLVFVAVAQMMMLGGYYERIVAGRLAEGTVALRYRALSRYAAAVEAPRHLLAIETPSGGEEIEVDAETYARSPEGTRVQWTTIPWRPGLRVLGARLGPSSTELLLSVLLGIATLIAAGALRFDPLPWYWQRRVRMPIARPREVPKLYLF